MEVVRHSLPSLRVKKFFNYVQANCLCAFLHGGWVGGWRWGDEVKLP